MLVGCLPCEARPGWVLFVFDCLEPRWFGWESCSSMVVSHEFGLSFQLVHVVDCFDWWWLVWEEFCWASIAEDCVGVFIFNNLSEGYAAELGLFTLPPAEYCAAREGDDCFVGVVDVDFVFVKNCNVVCVDKLWDAEEGVAFNSWHDVYVLCGVADVMMEFIHVAFFLHLAVGHAESFVRLSSCWGKSFSIPVSFCPFA